MMELVSRIKAVLRRTKKEKEEGQYSVGNLSMDLKKHVVFVDGKQVTLTLKEFELLGRLVQNHNIVLTRDRLLEEVWGYDFDGETRTVDVHVRTLRQKLGSAGDMIQTVRGVGYRLGGSMRVKIQKSMLLVLCITLLTTFSLLIAATYFQSLNNMKAELKQEAVYIQTAINISGTKYLEDMDAAQVKTRLTVIDENGTVLYDSKEDDFTFENHKERKEVKDAFANGWGEDLRKSNTLGEQTYYYALTLNDGNILRVAKTVDNVQPAIMDMLPYMAVIAVGMFCFAYFLAKWQTSRLIRPINLSLIHI